MIIYCFSDAHLAPGGRPSLEAFLKQAREEADLIVGCGDNYDLARHTMKEILEDGAARRAHGLLLDVARQVPTYLIEGNHDYNLRRYSALLGNIKVTKPFTREGFHFTHGWEEFDMTLRWLRPFYGWLFPYFRRWAWLYDLFFGATPSALKRNGPQPPPRFYQFTTLMHFRAILRAIKHDTPLVFGHTHWAEIRHLERWRVANCGDFLDSHTAIIIREGRLARWKWRGQHHQPGSLQPGPPRRSPGKGKE